MMNNIRLNMQQQPKSVGHLINFQARPGCKLIQQDTSAVEPRVITNFSKDSTMWSLYGPDAKANDIYLYNGSHIELFRDELRQYYDPDNPTSESIANAKKHCKTTRNLLKLITLASGYGASWQTIQSNILLQGYALSDQEAQIIHRDYWLLYPGIKDFERELKTFWRQTGGWIPSSMGNPICVYHGFLHDIVNRFAQRSGHEVLMSLVYHTERLRQERKIEMHPWIPDWHDEQIWEVPEDNVDAVYQLMKDAETALNEELKWDVYMEAEPEIADNLAQIKCDKEDYDEWIAKHGTSTSPQKRTSIV